jgi:hypothetical protein
VPFLAYTYVNFGGICGPSVKTLRVALWLWLSVWAHAADNPLVAGHVGIYHWGGTKADGIASGIRDVLALNGSIVRFVLSPRMGIDYNLGANCIAGFRLDAALENRDFETALADPRLKVAMITAYDGASFADCWNPSYLNLSFYSQTNTDLVTQEYSDFVYKLYLLFHGTGKKFILANWEGDNAIYCGSAYSYTTSDSFRSQCDQQYSQYYGGNTNLRDSIEAMIDWHRARFGGVQSGIARAQAEGLGGIEVLLAAEISSVHMLNDQGFPSVLYDVLPRVHTDYVSYSAWESLSHPDPATALPSDLDQIQSVTGSNAIIVGEFGFSRQQYGDHRAAVTGAFIEAALRWGVPYLVYWNLYDSDPSSSFGIFDVNGALTDIGVYYQQVFADVGVAAR